MDTEDFDSHITHRDALAIPLPLLPLCYQWRVTWHEGTTLNWRWCESKSDAQAFCEKLFFPQGGFTAQELYRAVSGRAAMSEHDAKVAENTGLHGQQLAGVKRAARIMRAAANKLRP